VDPGILETMFFHNLRVQTSIADALRSWSSRARLYVLSNHRAEWLLPKLTDAGLTGSFEAVYISDRLGMAKPDSRIFRYVASQLPSSSPVLYVDDDQRNLDAAAGVGWQTLLAAETHEKWIENIHTWCGTHP
jgi:putative hydrolase of the HAD superfamily